MYLTGAAAGSGGFMEQLRGHLHAATAQVGGAAGCGNPRYFDTEACAAAAAAMLLARQLGDLQVLAASRFAPFIAITNTKFEMLHIRLVVSQLFLC